jgi:putative ABC transport system permease protein
MTELGVALRYLRARRITSLLSAASVALGVSLVVASVLVAGGIKTAFLEGATDYNLVVGAKGGATQLVLNVVFRLDSPLPNILLPTYEGLQDDRRVEVAVPVAMGDAYQGFRYVATTPGYFAAHPWRQRRFTVASGRLFHDDTTGAPSHEAVLGAEAARRTGLRIGDRFYEGEEMATYPLTVVGILRARGSADDRSIFLSLPSYWDMNEIARAMPIKPLTAVLVRPRRMSDLPALHRQLNLAEDTQAVFPSAVLLGIFNLLDVAEDVLTLLVACVAIVVVLYLLVSMYGATWARRREIATMRALGAPRSSVLRIVLLECAAITAVGAAAGVLGGHALAYLGAQFLSARAGVVAGPLAVSLFEPAVLAGVVLVGTLAGLVPAVMAYRMEVAENLAPLS